MSQYEIELADSTKFYCNADESILDAADRHGVVLPNSCRDGRCDTCEVRLVSGEVYDKSSGDGFVADADILTCSAVPKSDVRLECRDLIQFKDYPAQYSPVKIEKIKKLCATVVEVTLRFPKSKVIRYLPGQYVDVYRGSLKRSYSISNSPLPDGVIKLQIKQYQNGAMSKYWFSEAKVGDLLRLRGPLGTFSLRDDGAESLIFLATGTGLAPVIPILEQVIASGKFNINNIFLYWGAKNVDELYYPVSLKFPGVIFKTSISGNVDSAEKRYIQHQAVEDNCDLKKFSVYACGNSAMIKDSLLLMTKHGLEKAKFYSDAFLAS